MTSTIKQPTIRVAVTQHEPIWLDLEATTDKTCHLIASAASANAKLVVFPECWIPGYPAWIWSRPVDFDLGVKYVENSLEIDSPQMRRIRDAAATHQVNVGLGFSERDGDSVYIAQALIDEKAAEDEADAYERTIFGDASGSCLAGVVQLSDGGPRPLLKYYTLSQNEQIHIAGWPPLDPFVEGSPGFWSMTAEGCRSLSQTYAAEAGAYVLHCAAILTETGIEAMKTKGSPIMGSPTAGSSAIIGPDGRLLKTAESGGEQLIIADLNMSEVTKTKTFADAGGHYSRPDMLWLGADPTSKPTVRIAKPDF
ncbi:hypothetical protein LTS02_000463 [Friedmanniomyces endolithicus]|nr:hypothetical protein LTS02_000463 [Friedmanniomyces endolithicus]